MRVDIECVVLGAGVVGLAIARHVSLAGHEVFVTEAESAIGTGVSARNSEVIHAGIYYPPGSLKANLCVDGKAKLYAYCQDRGVPHKQLGKLIVATDTSQHSNLEKLFAKGLANGVQDLQWLSAQQAQTLEPALRCTAAIYSPSTGIIDTHALMLSLQGDGQQAGAQYVLNSPLKSAHIQTNGTIALTFNDADQTELTCRWLVNAAGLNATHIAKKINGLAAHHIPTAYLCKGSYFSMQGRVPFSHLIYPAPHEAGLGVHLTLDLAGQARFGPDIEWVEEENYDVDAKRADAFYDEVRRYWPDLKDHSLTPDYAGIRPKVVGPHEPAHDFIIQGYAVHGVPGLVNLFGIESPGITACLAIAEHVYTKLNK
jgi:L-2-hydroxyglutarate oxidase LhgO